MSTILRVRATIGATLLLALVVGLVLVRPWPFDLNDDAKHIQGSGASVLSEKVAAVAQGNSVQGNNGNGNNGNGNNGNANNPSPTPQATPPSKTFKIEGLVDGLAPGVLVPLKLSVINDLNQDLIVTTLAATVKSVTPGLLAGNCTADDVVIKPWNGKQFTVERRTSVLADGWIPIRLSEDASDACQGAVFTLSYTGTAVQG